MATKMGPITAAIQAALDREIDAALEELNIPSRTAFRREQRRMSAQNYYGWAPVDCLEGSIPDPICARAQAIYTLDGLVCDGIDATQEDRGPGMCAADNWLLEVKVMIPRALKRPLNKRELAEYRVAWEACYNEDSKAA